MQISPRRQGDPRPWDSLSRGALVVVDRTKVVLVGDDPLAGCAPTLVGGLHDPSDDHELATPSLPADPVEGARLGAGVRARVPFVLEATGDGGFWVADGDGEALRLDVGVARILAACRRPRQRERVEAALAAIGGPTLDALLAAGLLVAGADAVGHAERRIIHQQRAHRRLDRALRRAPAPPTDGRIPLAAVWARCEMDELIPLGLGYLLATIRASPRLHDRYRAEFVVPTSVQEAQSWAADVPPTLFLFSHYVWNSAHNLAVTAAVKAADPRHLTVHGGPSVPGYPAEREQFLRDHPGVDVLVHGEGEATFTDLLEHLGPDLDPAPLAGRPGMTVRTPGGSVTGPPRERIADLGTIPSPFLGGVFDGFLAAGLRRFVMETNRGCPFGCTFCDWGSATNTRLRTFPLDRVEAEIDWLAANDCELVVVADSNFGMLPRDVGLTDRLVTRHEQHGHPQRIAFSMAKNPNRRYFEIVDRMADAGLMPGGGLSLQTYDPATLAAVDRENIPPDRYDEIWRRLRQDGRSVFGEFMVGLPGATRESFRADLQFTVDREISFLVNRTMLLANNPMNDPAYRAEHRIVTDAEGALVATRTYSTEDLRAMLTDYQAVYGGDQLGCLRVVLRFLRQRIDRTEVDLVTTLAADARRRPEAMPGVRWFLTNAGRWGCGPAGWDRFYAEVRAWVDEQGWVADDDPAFTSVLRAQAAMVPRPARAYPLRVPLAHDVAEWYRQTQEAKLEHRDWRALPDVRTHPPAELVVDDPWEVAENLALLAQPHGTSGWEIDSPFQRPGTNGSLLVV